MGEQSAVFEIIHTSLMHEDTELSVSAMCEIAGVSRSGYYRWVSAAETRQRREEQDKADFELILAAWVYPKICVKNNEAVQNANQLRASGQRSHPMSACVHHSIPDGRSQGWREAPFIAAPARREHP